MIIVIQITAMCYWRYYNPIFAFSSEMDLPTLQSKLKPRSGKSVKCAVKNIVAIFETILLVLLANDEIKFAVIMQKDDQEKKFQLEVGKTYLVRNVEFAESKMSIPLFKVEKTSSFRLSLVNVDKTQIFTSEEIASLQSIDTIQYFSSSPVEQQTHYEPPKVENTLPISLKEFLKLSPEKVSKNMYVEVGLKDF